VLRGEGRRWHAAAATAVVSAGWAALCFGYLMPRASSDPAVISGLHPLVGRWAHLGTSYPAMLEYVMLHPGYVAGLLVSKPMLGLLASTGAVALLDPPALLAALPETLAHLASGYRLEAELGSYYGILPITLLFPAVVFGARRVQVFAGERAALVLAAIALCFHPRPEFLDAVGPSAGEAERLVRSIDDAQTACLQWPIAPHHAPTAGVRLFGDCGDFEWLAFAPERERFPTSDADYWRLIKNALESGEYGIAGHVEPIWVLRRGLPSNGNAAAWAELRQNYGEQIDRALSAE
jgi:hypothetical protein